MVFISWQNMFPRLRRNEDRKYERWKDKERKTFEDEMDYWLRGTPMSGIFYSENGGGKVSHGSGGIVPL